MTREETEKWLNEMRELIKQTQAHLTEAQVSFRGEISRLKFDLEGVRQELEETKAERNRLREQIKTYEAGANPFNAFASPTPVPAEDFVAPPDEGRGVF
jgi:cell division protein FtsB